jgi:hypothetical protein
MSSGYFQCSKKLDKKRQIARLIERENKLLDDSMHAVISRKEQLMKVNAK